MSTLESFKKVRAADLQLADRIMSIQDPTLGIQTVKQIENGMVTLFRPYTHTADFSYTGGVICYLGFEEYQIYQNSPAEYVLLERRELK